MASDRRNTRKRLMMAAILEICRSLRVGNAQKYEVVRGAVNWATWDFSAHPLAISVHCDECSFLRSPGNDEGVVSLEIMGKMPDGARQVDDDLLDSIVDDATEVFERLEDQEVDEGNGDVNPAISMLDRRRDSAIEVSDVSRGVQGVVATARVTF